MEVIDDVVTWNLRALGLTVWLIAGLTRCEPH
jgi:hypothetical protein